MVLIPDNKIAMGKLGDFSTGYGAKIVAVQGSFLMMRSEL